MALIIPTNVEELTKKIKYALGGKNLNVELYEEEVEMALTDALILISTYRPVYKKSKIETKNGVCEYLLEPDCIAVSTIYTAGIPNIKEASTSPYNVWRRTTRNFMLGTNLDNYINFYQTSSVVRFLTYINDQASILGMNVTFRRNGRKIQIQPTPIGGDIYIYEYNYIRDLNELSPFESTWVYKYTLGKCFLIVGEKRSKFGDSLPLGIDGLKLNGEKLIDRGNDLIKEALEELKKIQAPLLPLWGTGV